MFWIQDYHFLALGEEMRRLKIGRPIGFFLHTPWSDRRTMAAVPHHADLVRAMLSYDLIGFQTDEDRQNFEDYLQFELGLSVVDGTVTSTAGLTHLATFPIGIDVDEFTARATKASTRAEVSRLRGSLQAASSCLASIGSTIPKAFATGYGPSTGCWRPSRSSSVTCRSSRLRYRRAATSGLIAS